MTTIILAYPYQGFTPDSTLTIPTDISLGNALSLVGNGTARWGSGGPPTPSSSGFEPVGLSTATKEGLADVYVAVTEAAYDPRRSGAVLDGVTDDGPALSAAYVVASGAASGYSPGQIRINNADCRIATSVLIQDNVEFDAPGSLLIGPITGAAPINSGNNPAVPGATNVAAQTAGAAFTDAGGGAVHVGLSWQDVHLQGFRYGMLSQSLAWQFAMFRRVYWENCNIGHFAYQGALEPIFESSGSIGGASGTSLVVGATGFASGHPYAGLDNYFADGVVYDGKGIRDGATRNTTFDAWFTAAIMRPTTPSIAAGGTTTYPFSDTPALAVSGRNIYAPQRNNREQGAWAIRNVSTQSGDFGFALIANPDRSTIKNVTGEFCFTAGEQSMVLALLTGVSGLSGIFENIDGAAATNPCLSAVEVRAPSGVDPGALGKFTGKRISGGILGLSAFLEFDAPSPRAADSFIPEQNQGWFINPLAVNVAAFANTLDRMSAHIFNSGPEGLIINLLDIDVTIAAAGGSVRAGIYIANDQVRPFRVTPGSAWGKLLKECGTAATTSTGHFDITPSPAVAIPPNTWFAVAGVDQGASATRLCGSQYNASHASPLGHDTSGWGPSQSYGGYGAIALVVDGVTGALPTTLTPSAVACFDSGVGILRDS